MLQRQHTRARLPAVNVGCLTLLRLSITRRANASTRGELQSFQPMQQSLNAGWVPFAASRGWYLSLAQLACDGIDGDKASFLKIGNCRGQRLSSCVRSTLLCLSIVDPGARAPCEQALALQHPHYSGVMPFTTMGSRYSSSVQLFRQRPARNETWRHQFPNDRDQSMGAGVCGSSLACSSTAYPSPAGRSFPVYSLHWAFMRLFKNEVAAIRGLLAAKAQERLLPRAAPTPSHGVEKRRCWQ